jgi:hypothetical protein
LILETLEQNGADLPKPREVLHHTYFSRREAADAAAETMRTGGYRTRVEEAASADDRWLAVAVSERVVDESTVGQGRAWFEQVAADHGGAYDGWEAAVS